ncbi:hypothetical protein SAY86_021276 [Trapa natans]|uniref:Uncharacterized protein n=1 Tax=Trapa natans TaxID=22666 RepID=A0AAN7M9H2_TRANT|nr:hypothetical protein SAY86_021276 [Trapa natans]
MHRLHLKEEAKKTSQSHLERRQDDALRLPVFFIGFQSHGSYEPLDSYNVRVDPSITENENSVDFSGSPPSNKHAQVKIIKKVRFDLNVRAYEPIPQADISPTLSEDGEEENKEKGDGETAVDSRTAMAGMHSILELRNCIDSYDEDDDLVYQDLDFHDGSDDELGFFDDDFSKDGIGFNGSRTSKEDMRRPGFGNLHQKLEEQAPLIHPIGNKIQEAKMLRWEENAQYRSKCIHPVLAPVENVMQWKKIKAKEALPSLQPLKENQGRM